MGTVALWEDYRICIQMVVKNNTLTAKENRLFCGLLWVLLEKRKK